MIINHWVQWGTHHFQTHPLIWLEESLRLPYWAMMVVFTGEIPEEILALATRSGWIREDLVEAVLGQPSWCKGRCVARLEDFTGPEMGDSPRWDFGVFRKNAQLFRKFHGILDAWKVMKGRRVSLHIKHIISWILYIYIYVYTHIYIYFQPSLWGISTRHLFLEIRGRLTWYGQQFRSQLPLTLSPHRLETCTRIVHTLGAVDQEDSKSMRFVNGSGRFEFHETEPPGLVLVEWKNADFGSETKR